MDAGRFGRGCSSIGIGRAGVKRMFGGRGRSSRRRRRGRPRRRASDLSAWERGSLIPLRDENPSGSVAYLTIGLIAINGATFVYEIVLGPGLRDFMFQWGLVPERLTLALRVGAEPLLWPGVTLLS